MSLLSCVQLFVTPWRPLGSSIPGTFQARILEWVVISFSRGIFPTEGLNLCPVLQMDFSDCNYSIRIPKKTKFCCLVAKLCLSLCNPVNYSPLGSNVHKISRQEYRNGLPFPSPLIDINSAHQYLSLCSSLAHERLQVLGLQLEETQE